MIGRYDQKLEDVSRHLQIGTKMDDVQGNPLGIEEGEVEVAMDTNISS